MRGLFFGLGLCLGFLAYEYGDGHLNREARAEVDQASAEAQAWLAAHKARDKRMIQLIEALEGSIERLYQLEKSS